MTQPSQVTIFVIEPMQADHYLPLKKPFKIWWEKPLKSRARTSAGAWRRPYVASRDVMACSHDITASDLGDLAHPQRSPQFNWSNQSELGPLHVLDKWLCSDFAESELFI